MKDTIKTSRTAGYLEKMFRALNQDFFNGELEEPIITIQSTPRAYGHVTVSKIWRKKEDWRHELNISADTLTRPIENVAATMLHEMVHLYNMANGIQDCSRNGTYHNKKFRDEAEKRGLVIEHDSKYGWTKTKPAERLLDYVLQQGWTDIEMNRGLDLSALLPPSTGQKDGDKNTPGNERPKAKSSTRKYICPCCGQSVRATKVVNIICGNCKVTMEPA